MKAIKVGGFFYLFGGSIHVEFDAKCGEMVVAERAFECMPKQNAVSWNSQDVEMERMKLGEFPQAPENEKQL